jgi:hypothetical protein
MLPEPSALATYAFAVGAVLPFVVVLGCVLVNLVKR